MVASNIRLCVKHYGLFSGFSQVVFWILPFVIISVIVFVAFILKMENLNFAEILRKLRKSLYVSVASILSAFPQLGEATIIIVISVLSSFCQSLYLSVCPFPLDGFSWNLSIFRKSIEKVQVSLKSKKNKRCFSWIPLYILYHLSPTSTKNQKY